MSATTEFDLSIFGLEFDGAAIPDAGEVAAIVCGKCHGRGNFIGYTGRVVGKCFACEGTGLKAAAWGAEPEGKAIDVSAIAVSFAAANAAGIKFPKLRMGDGLVFSRAPDTGRNAGAIYVKCYGAYIGKIMDGRYLSTPGLSDATVAQVIAVAANPHDAAKVYGMKTGKCSCCGRELTNGLSIELGIGPICRDKFGW